VPPKSGKVRAVPMAPQVATALAKLAARTADESERDLVLPGMAGAYLDASALYRRYKPALADAGLRSLRFHDLRHTPALKRVPASAAGSIDQRARPARRPHGEAPP